MAVAVTDYAWRWDVDAYLRAWEAGTFDGNRVELIDGVVVPVSIGDWHGDMTFRIAILLGGLASGPTVTGASLVTDDSVPDPDCWVRRAGASGTATTSPRLSRWHAADVLLVVEVAASTLALDRGPKSKMYARAGFAHYWVVHRDGVDVFTEPSPDGYRSQVEVPADGSVQLPYADATISVADLLAT